MILNKKITFFFISTTLLLSACTVNKSAISPEYCVVTNEQPSKPIPKKTLNEIIAGFVHEYCQIKYPELQYDTMIYVSVKHQKLYLLTPTNIIKSYPVSTAKKGIGSKANSMKTPLGLHRIKNKIGHNAAKNTIFVSRKNTGRIATIYKNGEDAPKDYVTSRIMWLEGLEEGKNKGRGVDSYQRYIYIHGTAEEGKIGSPASHGCIRMYNDDVIELFNLVDEGTLVLILKY